MKKKLMQLALLSALVIVAAVVYIDPGSTSLNHVDGLKIMSAVHAFKKDLVDRGVAVPESVSLSELMLQGHLKASDVEGFRGLDVTFNLGVPEGSQDRILAQAIMPDGSQIITLADGSVHHR